ncbi:MAG: DUF308 domain-containing protein [Candidatus Diapherotrites archaeon]|nr:DUF308 domain-containing protein [Candidatus Diapherotrites archaeon]
MKDNEFFAWIMYIFAAFLFLAGMLSITDGVVGFIQNSNAMGSTGSLVGGVFYVIVGFVMAKMKDWV